MILETYQHKGIDIEILPDSHAQNPREMWDNLGTFLVTMWFNEARDVDIHWIKQSPYKRLEQELGEQLAIMMPIYKFEHAMIALSTTPFSCPWDSGQIGWIYITRNEVLKAWGRKRLSRQLLARVEKLLDWEVVEMSNYLNGSVYGYRMLKDGQEIDACFGFYSGIDLLKEEVNAQAERLHRLEMERPTTRAMLLEYLGA